MILDLLEPSIYDVINNKVFRESRRGWIKLCTWQVCLICSKKQLYVTWV